MSDESPAPPVKRSRRKLLLLSGGGLILVLCLAGGAWFAGIIPHRNGGRNTRAVQIVAEKPVLVDLPDVLANLDTGGRRTSFIKLKSKLQVAHAADVAAVQADMPQILDLFQTYLRSTRPDELHDGEGVYRLRETLMGRLDGLLAPVEVTDLLFTEMLIQ
ncbi:flagellar basal body-associated FliL family protein [Rhizosaccharibacter radicis]|uniref:Flagellar protein FliL n=1 Tax=Rhizosaccharibacter radicis TaxID=2782605 RepID=A0ABT1VZ91_9PROT|nr:flagellar basal body-associated FliL family protein [Acetobacteraceae bacterium KSS12]